MSQVYFYPPASLTAIGINGFAAPTYSIEMGGINPGGFLQPLQTNNSGDLKVEVTNQVINPIFVQDMADGLVGDTVPTIAIQVGANQAGLLAPLSLDGSGNLLIALPPGAATEAKQDSQITLETAMAASLSSIDTKLTSPISVTGPLTDTQLRASAVPVSAASLPLPSGAATEAKQDTGNASLASIDSKLTSPLAVTGPLTDAQLRATPVPISGSISATNPSVSTTGTAIPASATMIGGSDGTDLQAIKVSATGVVSVEAASLPLPTGAATAANQATANASLSSIDTKLTSPLAVTGPLTDAELRASAVPVSMASSPLPTGAATAANQATEIASLASIDGKITVCDTGAVTVSSALPTGANVIGKVSIDQTTPGTTNAVAVTNLPTTVDSNFGAVGASTIRTAAQIGNATGAADFGSGVASAQTLRVSPATDVPTPAASGRAKANTPTINDYTSTSVTSAAYVQLIASTTSATNMVEIFDSSGVTLYFAVGGAGSEVNQFIITPGGNGQVPLAIPAGSRVSIKATSTSATVGVIVVNLYT